MDTLDERRIRERLSDGANRVLETLDVFGEIDSTSTYLLSQPSPGVGRWRFAIAARQTAGRGRGENSWHSPAGGGLWMSGAYTFHSLPANLSALTLAIGVGVADALAGLGVDTIRLKWPNDLLLDGGKLGGILLDTASAASTNLTVVCGVGLNVRLENFKTLEAAGVSATGFRPVDLGDALAEVPPIEELAPICMRALMRTVSRYASDGFGAFIERWRDYDFLHGRRVSVSQSDSTLIGAAEGIADNGALLVRVGDDLEQVVSGSVRLAEGLSR